MQTMMGKQEEFYVREIMLSVDVVVYFQCMITMCWKVEKFILTNGVECLFINLNMKIA